MTAFPGAVDSFVYPLATDRRDAAGGLHQRIADLNNAAAALESTCVNVFNPMAYGAVGNGTTLDDTAVNAAMSAACAAGGTVLLTRPHKVSFTGTLGTGSKYALRVTGDNVTIRCEGKGQIVCDTTTATAVYRAIVLVGGGATTVNNIRLVDVVIDGLSGNDPTDTETSMPVVLDNCAGVLIQGCEIKNYRGDGISHGQGFYGKATNIRITGNEIHHGVGQAIGMNGEQMVSGSPITGAASDWIITNNNFHDSIDTFSGTSVGISETIIISSASHDILIEGNTLRNWGSITISSTANGGVSSQIDIKNNIIVPAAGGKGGVFLFDDCNNCSIVDNIIDVSNTTGSGVDLDGTLTAGHGCANLRIEGNIIRRRAGVNGQYGITVNYSASSTNLHIDGNTFMGATASDASPDIYIPALIAGLKIRRNMFLSTTQAICVINGSGVVVTDNVCTVGGIMVKGVTDGVVSSNVVTLTGNYNDFGGTLSNVGIIVWSSPRCQTRNNWITATYGIGIYGSTTTDGDFTGNWIKATTGHVVEANVSGIPDRNRCAPNCLVGTPVVTILGASSVGITSVTGSRGANAALASLLTALAKTGLIVDNST